MFSVHESRELDTRHHNHEEKTATKSELDRVSTLSIMSRATGTFY
jgi:hypothetical protein